MNNNCTNCCNDCRGKYCASKVPIFENLDCDELSEIVKSINHNRYSKGEVLFSEGSVANNMFFVNEGKVKLYKYTKEGKEQILHILTKGDFLGESNLFNDEASRFSVTAITNARICTISKENLEDILIKNPPISLKIIKEISKKLSETEDLAKVLATKDVVSRVASMLVEFSTKYGQEDEEGILIKLPINREDMASYCGVTRETISRKLSKFESDKLISVRGNKIIIITELEKLRELSE